MKLAALLFLIPALVLASDASTDKPPHPLSEIVGFASPPGCTTFMHARTKQFQVVCPSPKVDAPKKAKKK